VAGTIAASVNGKGVVGVAPEVKIMSLKFIGPWSGSTSDAIEAIEYAKAEGVKISNNSWGGWRYSQSLKDAIEKSDSLFVAAAGNWGENNDGRWPHYPASYDSPNILSVAAINNKGKLPWWSNYGARSVDISAPGVSVLSSVPGMPPGTSGAVLSSVGTSGGKALTVGFGADEIGDSAKRQSFFEKAFEAVDRNGQQVVLVDDDQSDYQSGWGWYPDVGATLNSDIQSVTGSAPQEIDVPYWANGPSYEELSGKTVVWATGYAYNSYWGTTLTSTDQDTLTRFLNDGGKLIITGTDALYRTEDSTFVTETLNLDVISDVGGESFIGTTGTTFAGESYAFNDTYYAPYHDKVAPAASAAVSQGSYAAFDKWEPFSGTSMAAPHVTGTAALVASVNPVLRKDPVGLKSVVMHSGKPLSATSGKTVTGDMVNAKKAVVIPIITSVKPAPGFTAKDRTPTVGATVRDSVTQLAKTDIRLRIDGKAISAFSYDRDMDRLSYTPKENLSYGNHTIRVEATDREHNKGWRQWTFKVIERR
ncbi:MAG TPA: S8 family serine peptidase, partial [Rubrobacter sp.]|nr:S8 family serine peptidase [Rubrobacter sp.]